MTIATRPPRPARRPLARALAPVLVLLGLLVAACATQNQVAQIVASSNAAMLAGRFDLAVAPTAGPDGKDAVQQEYDRIETFLADHQDPQYLDLTTPLRLRRAVLLLNNRELNLAKAAFAEVDGAHLHTARDRALLEHKDTLLWWFGASARKDWTDGDRAAAKQAMVELLPAQERLGDSVDIRDYLAEMRAWIGIVAAKHAMGEGVIRSLLEDALRGYATIFDDDDLKALKVVPTGAVALGPKLRRQLRARAVLDQARTLNLQLANENRAQVGTPAFEEWIKP